MFEAVVVAPPTYAGRGKSFYIIVILLEYVFSNGSNHLEVVQGGECKRIRGFENRKAYLDWRKRRSP